jgi:tetratricopeptide (TPR) repeat protein
MRWTALLFPALLLLLGPSPRARAQEKNPHDGYAFWLPNGTLTVGDPASEKAFGFERKKTTPNGQAKARTTDSFTVPLRKTRFDTPNRGNLVVVAEGAGPVQVTVGTEARFEWSGVAAIWGSVSEQPSPTQTVAYSIPRRGSNDPAKVFVSSGFPSGGPSPTRYRFYFTDDADVWPGNGDPHQVRLAPPYAAGVAAFLQEDYFRARGYFQIAEKNAKTPEQARYARRFIRWCDAQERFPQIARQDAKGFYDLGLYSMVNGFWELAEKSFRAATEASPKDADAWYMLGDAASYVHSDLDGLFETVLPYYKKAADLYPRDNSNVYRNHMGLFKNLRVGDGKGGTVVMHLTPEQIADTKRKWEFCTAVMEAASRGTLRFENQWVVYDKEFDNSAPMEHDPAPFEGLWEPGTVDTFMKFTGWGASDAVGADCGANRSADVNIGMREWDVLYHEWNHTLDWLMGTSGLGIGVPETHSSDWTGFQPISSMGMGHHSTNRYYMTPGMYRFIKGSDKPTTPWVSEWLVSAPQALDFDFPDPPTDASIADARATEQQAASPLSTANVPQAGSQWSLAKASDGYVDLKTLPPNAARNGWTWAHTYVYSPADQKVRAWIGADDNARVWVNNTLAYTGNYWSVCKFEEAHEKDQIATMIPLKKGWNSVLMQVSNVLRIRPSDNPPHPFYYGRPDAWGFSLRLCDNQNRQLSGVRYQADRPKDFDAARLTPVPELQWANDAPKTFTWAKVKDDYTQDLPHLSLDDLRAVTGYKNLTVTNEMLFDPGEASDTPRLRSGKADPSETALNNALNWFFSPKEMVAMLRYDAKDGKKRDLVFLRPEMYEAFMALAKVSPEAKARGIKAHGNQVIGYFTVPRSDSPNGRIVLVLDTYLGDHPPVDEEDLLGFGNPA